MKPKEIGLPFNDEMVRAILEGRKTHTRRPMRRQPRQSGLARETVTVDAHSPSGFSFMGDVGGIEPLFSPFGEPGDCIRVREAWQTGFGSDGPQITFRATPDYFQIDAWDGEDEGAGPSFNYARCPGATWHTNLCDLIGEREGYWRPSIHMPRWAARIFLKVIKVWPEPLQDITEESARAEGMVFDGKWWHGAQHPIKGTPKVFPLATQAYFSVWDVLYAKRGLDHRTNPWLWVCEFEVKEIKGVITPPKLITRAEIAVTA